jgi:hypothetical protein
MKTCVVLVSKDSLGISIVEVVNFFFSDLLA